MGWFNFIGIQSGWNIELYTFPEFWQLLLVIIDHTWKALHNY